MALDFEDDLDTFFNSDDFADLCILPAVGEADPLIINVILSTPDQESFAALSISADAKFMAKTSDVEDLEEDDQVIIKTVTYSIKKILAVDDGLVSDVYLTRL